MTIWDIIFRVYFALTMTAFIKKKAPGIIAAVKTAMATAKAYAGLKEQFKAQEYVPPTEEEYKSLLSSLENAQASEASWRGKYFELLAKDNSINP